MCALEFEHKAILYEHSMKKPRYMRQDPDDSAGGSQDTLMLEEDSATGGSTFSLEDDGATGGKDTFMHEDDGATSDVSLDDND